MAKRRRHLVHMLVLTALAAATLAVGADPAHAQAVEDRYLARGAWAVTYDNDGAHEGGTSDRCNVDRDGDGDIDPPVDPLTIAYPSSVGAFGDHAIVVFAGGWQPGAADPVCANRDWLEHLASWGFVVVAPNVGRLGRGTEMLQAVNEMIRRNGDPSSVFFGDLDTTRIAAVGHSQGADGAVNASIASGGRIRSTVSMSQTDPWWPRTDPVYDVPCIQDQSPWTGPAACTLPGPVLFVRGANDGLSTDYWQSIYYRNVTGAAAKATVAGADHVDVDRARGYVTAWLAYTLTCASDARPAFTGASPEIASNPDWSNWVRKGLPSCA